MRNARGGQLLCALSDWSIGFTSDASLRFHRQKRLPVEVGKMSSPHFRRTLRPAVNQKTVSLHAICQHALDVRTRHIHSMHILQH